MVLLDKREEGLRALPHGHQPKQDCEVFTCPPASLPLGIADPNPNALHVFLHITTMAVIDG